MADVEALYKCYGILADAGEKAGEHSAEYEAIIEGTKGDTSAKRLSANFIVKFFTIFPDLADRAIEAELDLCEDEDSQVRFAAIKSLPLLCREGSDNSPLGDVLAQLLQTDSTPEIRVVGNALRALLRKDTKAALTGLMVQVRGTEPLARERAVAYMGTGVVDMLAEVVHPHPDLEAYLLDEGKKALANLSGSELSSMMLLLRKLKSANNMAGTTQLAEALAEGCGIAGDNAMQGEELAHALSCAQEMAFLCKRGASPKAFVEFIVMQIGPKLGALPEDVQLMAAKALASLCHPLAMKPEDLLLLCEPMLSALMSFLPEAPQLGEDAAEPATEPATEPAAVPEVHYRTVECLLYAMHQLAKKCPTFMHSDEEATARLRLLKTRLQFLGMRCQASLKELKARTDEVGPVIVKAVQNISLLIKSFLKVPPAYNATITLSFVKPVAAAAAAAAEPAPVVTVTANDTPQDQAAAAQKRPVAAASSTEGAKRPMTGKELRQQYAAERAQQPQQQQQSGGGDGGNFRGGRGQGRGNRGRGSWRGRSY